MKLHRVLSVIALMGGSSIIGAPSRRRVNRRTDGSTIRILRMIHLGIGIPVVVMIIAPNPHVNRESRNGRSGHYISRTVREVRCERATLPGISIALADKANKAIDRTKTKDRHTHNFFFILYFTLPFFSGSPITVY